MRRCTRLKGSALHTTLMLHIISSILRTRPLLTSIRLALTGTQTSPTTSITNVWEDDTEVTLKRNPYEDPQSV